MSQSSSLIEKSFIQSIAESPRDDTPRLIYADWLDERSEYERAEFIRTQIELAKVDYPKLVYLDQMEVRIENQDNVWDEREDKPYDYIPSQRGTILGRMLYEEWMDLVPYSELYQEIGTLQVRSFPISSICYILPIAGQEQLGFYRGYCLDVEQDPRTGSLVDVRFRLIQNYGNGDNEHRTLNLLMTERRLYNKLLAQESFVNNLGDFRCWRRGFLWLVNKWSMGEWVRAGGSFFTQYPTIERVELEGVRPYRVETSRGIHYYWFGMYQNSIPKDNSSGGWISHGWISQELFERLNKGVLKAGLRGSSSREYNSQKEALDDLSDACILYAKETAKEKVKEELKSGS